MSVQLDHNDHQIMYKIIEAGSQRGMFKPEEMVAVGTVFNKLNHILTEAQKTEDAATPNSVKDARKEGEAKNA